jgi:hypothetical protein
LFNHLDYSFVAGHEDGTFEYPQTQPGGGSAALRNQLKILSQFIHGFEFWKMKPDNTVIKSTVPAGVSARALVDPGRAYAIYIRPHVDAKEYKATESIAVELPAGDYRAEWLNVLNGAIAGSDRFNHAGGAKSLKAPKYEADIAIRILAD